MDQARTLCGCRLACHTDERLAATLQVLLSVELADERMTAQHHIRRDRTGLDVRRWTAARCMRFSSDVELAGRLMAACRGSQAGSAHDCRGSAALTQMGAAGTFWPTWGWLAS